VPKPDHRPSPLLKPPEGEMTRGAADLYLMRKIIQFFGTWADCNAACRRHKRCASPTVACFDHNRDIARKILDEFANWRRLDGPREPDELTELITLDDLID
jgi:hypothetical protein